ncbi:respiratory burst oxidase homolog protein B-like [Triticum dicoccoides]|uniref:respiratory burst oxidase homolog protein B-like n=1 Tax=Triticum dicoccoides TaxID=85692 RepID=UPI001890575C|nr:respiratory burst oxidase homolog protein B-like [Triticum dicoccoides]
MPSRVGADDAGVGEIVEASGGEHERAVPPGSRSAAQKTARFTEPVPAPRGGGPSRLDRSMSSAPAQALEGLKFISETDASKGWTSAAGFFDTNSQNDLLPRSMFGECIGTSNVAFAGELFDTLARRRGISGGSIDKAELREFWDQISDPSIKSRLQLFFDMVDKNADGRISEAEVKQIITLSASANHLTITAQQYKEYVKLIMEELDPHGLGYIELHSLEMLLLKPLSETMTNGSKLPEPNWHKQLYRRARYFLKDNWCRCWVMLLWLSICAGLFAWKFMQYRHHAVFKVMGYCVCVAKGGAETLKFNMALTLLPVHPFSITSAPEDDCVSVHIKALGDWTEDLRDAFLKVCPNTEGKNEIRQVEYDRDDAKSNPRFPKILIDGPYGAPAEDYMRYEVVLLVGLGIGATPMISIIKDIINNTKRLGDIEFGNPGDASAPTSFKTRRAYFYWTTREQGSFEWFRGIMDEVAETDKDGIIELHTHCTSVHKEGDARSAPLTILQSLYYAKHGIDIISGSRVKTTFGRADWREVYVRIAQENQGKRVGVFYCGMPALTNELRYLAKDLSRKTSTRFEFHKENF